MVYQTNRFQRSFHAPAAPRTPRTTLRHTPPYHDTASPQVIVDALGHTTPESHRPQESCRPYPCRWEGPPSTRYLELGLSHRVQFVSPGFGVPLQRPGRLARFALSQQSSGHHADQPVSTEGQAVSAGGMQAPEMGAQLQHDTHTHPMADI